MSVSARGVLPLGGLGFERTAHRRGDEDWLAQAWKQARVLPDHAEVGRASE